MRRRILSILLPILLPLSVLAYDFQAGHLFYNILDPIQRQVEVTYEDPYQANLYARLRTVTIPAKVKKDSVEYTVIGIGETAFHNCPKLRRVRLPKTLQYIDSAACAEMLSLDSLTLPYGLQRISDAAFYHCPSLSYIDIPSTVDSIGHNVFRYCRLLRRIFVDPDNPRYDSRGNCNGVCLTDSDRLIATCSRTTFPFDLRQVGDLAFAYSPYLRKAILPDSVREIGYAAFADAMCSTQSIFQLRSTRSASGRSMVANGSSISPCQTPSPAFPSAALPSATTCERSRLLSPSIAWPNAPSISPAYARPTYAAYVTSACRASAVAAFCIPSPSHPHLKHLPPQLWRIATPSSVYIFR